MARTLIWHPVTHDRFPTFGIELSDRGIRIAECVPKRTGIELRTLSETPLPPSCIQDGDLLDLRKVTGAVASAVTASNLRARYAAVSLPERHTFMKLLTVPNTKRALNDESILWEATQHFPLGPEDAYFDWERVQSADAEAVPLLVAAAPKELVAATVSVFAQSKITPAVLEPETLSIWRALAATVGLTEPFLGISVGRSRSFLIVSDGRSPRFVTTDPFSGAAMEQTIAQKLHLSLTDAQKARRLFGLDQRKGKGATRTVLLPLLLQFTAKILATLAYYREHFPHGSRMTRVIVAGPAADVPGLPHYLSNAIGLPATAYEPRPSLHLADSAREQFETAPLSFATVIGLSLRDLL